MEQQIETTQQERRGAPRGRRGKGSRGQSLVEFAFVMPLLMILVFGIIDFSMGLRSYISLTNATREGARYGAVGNTLGGPLGTCQGQQTNTTVVGRVCTAIEGLKLNRVTSVSATCQSNDCSPGNSVVVSARYQYDFITPVGDLMNFFSGGSFSETLTLNTSTDMRLE